MTTIAWDGQVLAADKQAESAGLKFRTTKIGRLKDGRLYGFAGEADYCREVVLWLEGGAKPEQKDKDDWWTVLVIGEKIERFERRLVPIEVEEKTHALGSGRDYAMAAMYLGKSAEEAVLVAHRFDPATGSEVDTLTRE